MSRLAWLSATNITAEARANRAMLAKPRRSVWVAANTREIRAIRIDTPAMTSDSIEVFRMFRIRSGLSRMATSPQRPMSV